MDSRLNEALRSYYCRNCWESLRANGLHREDQPCDTPSDPVSYQELGDIIAQQVGAWTGDGPRDAEG